VIYNLHRRRLTAEKEVFLIGVEGKMEENIRSMVESGSAGMCMWVASVRGCIKQKGQRDIIGCVAGMKKQPYIDDPYKI